LKDFPYICIMNIFIPGNVPSSKNSRVWTGKFLVASKSTHKWRKDTESYWESMRNEFLEFTKDLQKPLIISFTFIRGTKHKFDYPNPLQTILDEMVTKKWIPDDNADEILPVFEKYEYNKKNPGVKIKIITDAKK
jgi:hypothetical protein